ncbi:MAG: acyl-CoA dehydrogenase family protein [Acidimicrobiia bacterium]
MMTMYDDTHELFRESFRSFAENEVAPHITEWEEAGIMDREVYAKAGTHGFLAMAVPEEYGGGGNCDFRFNALIGEELARVGSGGAGIGITLHNDVCTPYFIEYCTPEQSTRWMPGIASGELITAVAMTEPGTGSDLAGIATTAVRDGDEYILNGAKTFITNGINSDLVIVAATTDSEAGRGGLSLIVVERDTEGFERGRNLDKIGLHSNDTAELFFTDARVPVSNLLGEEGRGFEYLGFNLAQERLSIALYGAATARAALGWTVDYVKERTAFGQPISGFQNTKFVLAEVETEIDVTETYVADAVMRHNGGALSPVGAAKVKLWATEVQRRVIDRCLQLFGGYGYMTEYPIARAYADARVTTIYGGTSEIMKTIIAKEVLA